MLFRLVILGMSLDQLSADEALLAEAEVGAVQALVEGPQPGHQLVAEVALERRLGVVILGQVLNVPASYVGG